MDDEQQQVQYRDPFQAAPSPAPRLPLSQQLDGVKKGLAQMLENLADGEAVRLGHFSSNDEPNSEGDLHAMWLREIVDMLEGNSLFVPPEVQATADACDADASSGPSTFLQKVYVYESGNGHRWMADDQAVYTHLDEIPDPE